MSGNGRRRKKTKQDDEQSQPEAAAAPEAAEQLEDWQVDAVDAAEVARVEKLVAAFTEGPLSREALGELVRMQGGVHKPRVLRSLTCSCRSAARAAGVRRASLVGAARGRNGGGRERGARSASLHGARDVHLARRLLCPHRLRRRRQGAGKEERERD
jgi:hypothetical protein